jgi:hypothetical protein
VNVKGMYNCLHEAIPLMKKNKHGVIINMASVAGNVGLPDRFAYTMSKGAVLGMTLSVAKDYINDGIRCNSVSPARVHTPFVDGFISKNYASWVNSKSVSGPVMSHTLLKFKVLPHLEKGTPLFFILIDNLRFDQWKAIQPIFSESFRITEEDSFYSILPTATQYCRNAIFSGLLPSDIEKQFPAQWKNDEEEGGKNLHEEEFFEPEPGLQGRVPQISRHLGDALPRPPRADAGEDRNARRRDAGKGRRRLRDHGEPPQRVRGDPGSGQREVPGDCEQGQDRVSGVEVAEGADHDGREVGGVSGAGEGNPDPIARSRHRPHLPCSFSA